MYLEVNYLDQLGSVCPFCGTAYNQAQKTKLDYFKNEKREGNFYWMGCAMCSMPSLIVSFMIQTPGVGGGYSFQTRQFVFKQDYEDYFGTQIRDGEFEVPLCHEEDMVCSPAMEVDLDTEIPVTKMEGLTYGKSIRQPYHYGLYTQD